MNEKSWNTTRRWQRAYAVTRQQRPLPLYVTCQSVLVLAYFFVTQLKSMDFFSTRRKVRCDLRTSRSLIYTQRYVHYDAMWHTDTHIDLQRYAHMTFLPHPGTYFTPKHAVSQIKARADKKKKSSFIAFLLLMNGVPPSTPLLTCRIQYRLWEFYGGAIIMIRAGGRVLLLRLQQRGNIKWRGKTNRSSGTPQELSKVSDGRISSYLLVCNIQKQ